MEEKASMENAPKTRYECQKDSTATHLMIGDTALWKQFCDDNDSGNYDFRKTINQATESYHRSQKFLELEAAKNKERSGPTFGVEERWTVKLKLCPVQEDGRNCEELLSGGSERSLRQAWASFQKTMAEKMSPKTSPKTEQKEKGERLLDPRKGGPC